VIRAVPAAVTDGNTAGHTMCLNPDKTITIDHHRTSVGHTVYRNVEMADILTQLTARTTKRVQRQPVTPETLGPIVNGGNDPITADALYPRWANFFRTDDVIITDIGTSSLGLAFAQLPRGAEASAPNRSDSAIPTSSRN
jgi:indolepyruvate decarboxylase